MAATITGGLTVVLALAATAITVIVGHSGAQAVWAEGVGDAPAPSAPASSAAYTMTDVTAHATASDCWTAIDGTIYDLSTWAGQHPGGQQAIVSLCGTDGTVAYKGQHGSQKRPASALAQFAIGTLGGAKPTAGATASATAGASSTPTGSAPDGQLTMAEVKKHASASSCYSVVDGGVYDLTKWIGRHPGGRTRIIALCGGDGTASFRGAHGKQGGPNGDLKRYLIGPLTPA